jgi:hypothetical protein
MGISGDKIDSAPGGATSTVAATANSPSAAWELRPQPQKRGLHSAALKGRIMAKGKKRAKVQKRGKLPKGKTASRGNARKVAKAAKRAVARAKPKPGPVKKAAQKVSLQQSKRSLTRRRYVKRANQNRRV